MFCCKFTIAKTGARVAEGYAMDRRPILSRFDSGSWLGGFLCLQGIKKFELDP